jgi:hypothetical protein
MNLSSVLPPVQTDLGDIRARHLWEVMTMDGNTGSVPVALDVIRYENHYANCK